MKQSEETEQKRELRRVTSSGLGGVIDRRLLVSGSWVNVCVVRACARDHTRSAVHLLRRLLTFRQQRQWRRLRVERRPRRPVKNAFFISRLVPLCRNCSRAACAQLLLSVCPSVCHVRTIVQ